MKKNNYDIVLLDINMPKMNGIECARKIYNIEPKTKVLVLSQFGDKKLVDKLIKYNIDGYLLKSSTKEEIIKAIRDVYNNKKSGSDSVNPASRNSFLCPYLSPSTLHIDHHQDIILAYGFLDTVNE